MASKTATATGILMSALPDDNDSELDDIDVLAKKVVAKLKKAQAGISRLEVQLHDAHLRITELESREPKAEVG